MNARFLTILLILFVLLLGACSPAVSPTLIAQQPRYTSSRPTTAPMAVPTAVPQIVFPYPTTTQDTTFQDYGVNPPVDTYHDHLSTFGLDVDTASYTVMRDYINNGSLPPTDSVRVEEYVNYFDPGYPTPPDVAFGIYADGAPSPFDQPGTYLLRFGVQGYRVSQSDRKPVSLTFVIDVSGSMGRDGRLELVKQSLNLLVEQLLPWDTVGIVAYSTTAWTVLNPTSIENRDAIIRAIDSLYPRDTTNVEDGLMQGYQMAQSYFRPETANRLVLCSDGVANEGITNPDALLERVHTYVEMGIPLNTYGVGMGDYNDVLLEQLADNGDGSYAYIDTLEEARSLFVENLTSSLDTIALNAKIQIDFNQDVVTTYRLIGYENRAIADQNFRNDTVEAGEIGPGHHATAIYAVTFRLGAQGRIATAQLRWEDPQTHAIQEINGNINTWDLASYFEQASPRFQLLAIVAEYAEVLQQSPWVGYVSMSRLTSYACRLVTLLPEDADVIEFANLVKAASNISGDYE